jgi:hypothetical protein
MATLPAVEMSTLHLQSLQTQWLTPGEAAANMGEAHEDVGVDVGAAMQVVPL